MSRKVKYKSGLYHYLESKGILENGSSEDFTLARKEWRRLQKSEWRRNKRKKEKELTTSWDKEQLAMLIAASQKHKMSKTRFCKQATLAYINKTYIIPDALAVRKIAQYLELTYNTIQELMEEDGVPIKAGKVAQEKIFELERLILPLLHHPKPIEEWVAEAVRNQPHCRAALLKLLET